MLLILKMKKQFKLDNVSLSSLYKIEVGISKIIDKKSFVLNKDTKVLTITFEDEEKSIESIKEIVSCINDIDEDIEIEERVVKPVIRKVLLLENLDCANCAAKVERIAKRTFEHDFIVVDFASTKFIIETSNEEVIATLKEELQKIAATVDNNIIVSETKKHNTVTKEFKIDKKRKIEFFIGGIIFLLGFITKTIFNALDYYDGIVLFNHLFSYRDIIIYLTYVPGYYLLSKDVLYGAYKNIINGRVFDEKFLMSLATIVALLIKYYDEAILVMLFYKLGELCQQYAVNYSRTSIASLINIQPQTANVLVNGEIVEVSPEEVIVGDVILVKEGERIPLDGKVLSGSADLDTSALTGESLERSVDVDDKVLSGSICKNGSIKVLVEKAYEDSMASKILDMVENASSLKSKSENFISKFARFYTPVVVGLAILIAIFLPLINKQYDVNWQGYKESIRVALIFLVVSCPCALVISIPLGFFGGIGRASKEGILIKGSNYLEALNNVKTVVLDKTGTLTEGNFVLKRVVTLANMTKEQILYYAAHAEATSTHPIAKSIVEAYDKPIDSSLVSMIENTNKRGVCAKVGEKTVYIGRKEFLQSLDINLVKEVRKISNLCIAIDGVIVGYFVFRDRVKSNAKSTLQELKSLGIETTCMLTGDNEEIAREVATKTNIDLYYSEMTPLDKVDKMQELKAKLKPNEKIAFIGDGVNDTPVLSASDIGIAMGALGSDAAIEAADIVLMTDELNKIPEAIKIAKKTRRIVMENIILALVIKFAVLIIAPLGIVSINKFLIYEAIFADVGVSLIAIVNSLRIMSVKKK